MRRRQLQLWYSILTLLLMIFLVYSGVLATDGHTPVELKQCSIKSQQGANMTSLLEYHLFTYRARVVSIYDGDLFMAGVEVRALPLHEEPGA